MSKETKKEISTKKLKSQKDVLEQHSSKRVKYDVKTKIESNTIDKSNSKKRKICDADSNLPVKKKSKVINSDFNHVSLVGLV